MSIDAVEGRAVGVGAKELLYNICWKLAKVISITDSIAAGKCDLSDFDEPEQLRLANQFAEANGVANACAEAARQQQKSPLIIEMYEGFSGVYENLAYKCGRLSGEFKNHNELTEGLASQSNATAEFLQNHAIEPEMLFEAAQDTVENMIVDMDDGEKRKWWEFERSTDMVEQRVTA
jgi:hypothetical protein